MAKHLVAILVLVAGGVLLLAFQCDRVDEPQYEVELAEASVKTETVYLTEPHTYALSQLTWQIPGQNKAQGFIVEKKRGEDFMIYDTLAPNAVLSWADPDTLDCSEPVTYRLLALDNDKAYFVDTFTVTPAQGIEFSVPDTLLPQDDEIVFEWKPVSDAQGYEVKLMTLEGLTPIPHGKTIRKRTLDGNKTTWKVITKDISSGLNYILEVRAKVALEPQAVKEITGYRLFVLGSEVTDEEK